MEISPLTTDDLKIIAQYETENFLEYERYSLNELKNCINNPNYVMLKLYETDTIFSYIILMKVIDECELLKICTPKIFRGNGYAHNLLNYSINFLKDSGVTCIHLEVRSQNNVAISLYDSIGFKIIGKRKNYYGDDDATLMKLSLLE